MSLIHRVLQHIMGWVARGVCARPGLIVWVGVVLAFASVWVVATRFKVVNETSDLLSNKYASKINYNELVKDFGSDSRFIVLVQSPDPAQNRKAVDEIGPFLETLKPHITTVLYKIDFSGVKPRLLFTRDIPELKKIANQVEAQARAQTQNQKKSEQIALDLNSILAQANQKFNDKYLRQSSNWKDFTPFVSQFISILNKVADQAEGKTQVAQSTKISDDPNAEDYDSNEMLAEH
jgi:predicted RND superfamily exporter protein